MTLRRGSTRSTGTRAPRRGLSLIEVLLALAILVIALAAIGRLVDIGTDRGNEARMNTRGTRLAQAKMAEVEAGLISLSSETDGQFDGEDGSWSFKVIPEAAGPPNLYTVTVRVSRDFNGQTVEIALAQMMFDPTLMGSTAQAERPAAPDPNATGMTGTGGTAP